jgi:hypothetical protein
MIDTVVLRFPLPEGTGADLLRQGLGWEINSRKSGVEKLVRNPSKSELESGEYGPRFTLRRPIRRRSGETDEVRVELSVPKLLFGNNLDEVADSDLPTFAEILSERMERIGLPVSSRQVSLAKLSTLHYSRNIPLASGFSSRFVIAELAKANISRRYDLAEFQFRNEGRSLQVHSASSSCVFYDKVADLSQLPKRRIDRDNPPEQLALAATLRGCEILRFEVRLGKHSKIAAIWKRHEFGLAPTLADAFSSQKSNLVLRQFWEPFAADAPSLFSADVPQIDLLGHLVRANPGGRTSHAFTMTGIYGAARCAGGIRAVRAVLEANGAGHGWRATKASWDALNAQVGGWRPRAWVAEVEDRIDRYRPVRVSELTNPQLNLGL